MSRVQLNPKGRNDAVDGPSQLYRMAASRPCSYDVKLTEDVAGTGGELACHLGQRTAMIITTPTVESLYGDALLASLRSNGCSVALRVIGVKESNKSIEAVREVCGWAKEHNIERDGVLVAFGGGVLSDVVTTAASWIRRGIRHVRVPTTLVGQVDAGVGIKGAVNFGQRKGYLGCFFHLKRS